MRPLFTIWLLIAVAVRPCVCCCVAGDVAAKAKLWDSDSQVAEKSCCSSPCRGDRDGTGRPGKCPFRQIRPSLAQLPASTVFDSLVSGKSFGHGFCHDGMQSPSNDVALMLGDAVLLRDSRRSTYLSGIEILRARSLMRC